MRSATRGASELPDLMGSVTGESHARVISGPDHVALSGTGLEVRMVVEPSACFWRTAGPRGVRVDSHESVSLRVPDETWRRRELSASEMDDQRDGRGGGVAERSGRSCPLGTGRWRVPPSDLRLGWSHEMAAMEVLVTGSLPSCCQMPVMVPWSRS